MARIRTIKPEFPQSESMGRVSRESRLCFILLWTLADDAGRLRGNSRMLASLLYPYDDDAKKLIERWLTELHDQRCITRYTIDGDSYIQISAWLQHQKIDKPSPSKIPEPSRGFANVPADSETAREASTADQGKDQGKDQGEEGKGREPPAPAALTLDDLESEGVSREAAAEWIAVRKRKKGGPVTPLAWSGFKSQAVKAGWPLEAAVRKCVERSWVSFEAAWVAEGKAGSNGAPAGHTVPSRAADETARYLAERREQEQHATLPPAALLAKVRGAVKTEAA